MTELSALLAPGAVADSFAAANKKALFVQLGSLAADVAGLEARAVTERLTDRERLGSTGFGGGIAIPHGKVAGLDRIVGLFVRLDRAIDFEAVDDLPVDLVFALLSPPDAGAEHLKALAGVSRRLRDRSFVAKLRGAGSRDALYALLSDTGQRDAA
ncbi:PTS system nitrogen regulatory IIA component [Sphingomonas jejuensis]|uniref:PTS system nitrogen regulatory IIA component n=1 Tax=Sphingomonas jejuensis TaxID=904715 RepID=A0ABX0XP06_9SPHN|nr:PTS sugar transporter subunit IIA [Sphingomonas jejuensis]NJC34965.1 PTS system nitrogen regulatory IIA component [Sphingomonas jejuensis]